MHGRRILSQVRKINLLELEKHSLLGVRWAILFGICLRFWLQRERFENLVGTYIVIVIILLGIYNLVLTLMEFYRVDWRGHDQWILVRVSVDVLLFSLLYLFTWDAQSDFFLLYFLPLLTVADEVKVYPRIKVALVFLLVVLASSYVVLLIPSAFTPIEEIVRIILPRSVFYFLIILLVTLRSIRQDQTNLELSVLRDIDSAILEYIGHDNRLVEAIAGKCHKFFGALDVHIRLAYGNKLVLRAVTNRTLREVLKKDIILYRENGSADYAFLQAFEQNRYVVRENIEEDLAMRNILAENETNREAYLELQKINSYACFPLATHEKLGVMTVSFRERRVSASVCRKIEDFARRVSLVIEKGQNIERERQDASLIRSAYQVATKTMFIQRMESLFEVILEAATEILQASGGVVYMLSDDRMYLQLEAVYGINDTLYRKGYRIGLDQGMAGHVFTHQKYVIENEYAASLYHIPELRTHFQSVVEVPLRHVSDVGENELIGVIGVFTLSGQARNFSERDAEVLQIIADQTVLAMSNASKFELKQLLWGTVEIIKAVRDVGSIARAFIEYLSQTISFDTATVQIVNDGLLEVVYAHDFEQPNLILGRTFAISDNELPSFQVLETGKPLSITDIGKEFPKFLRTPETEGIRHWLGLPISFRNQVIGMITLDRSDWDFPFRKYEIDRASSYIQRVAPLLSDAVEIDIKDRSLQQAHQLAEVSQYVGKGNSLEDMAKRILDCLEELDFLPNVTGEEKFHKATVQLINNDENKTRFIISEKNIGKRVPELTRPVTQDKLVHRIIKTRQVAIIAHPRDDADWEVVPETKDVLSWIGIPVLYETEPLLFITLDSTIAGHYLSADANLLTLFANQIVVAVEHMRLITELDANIKKLHEAHNLSMIGLFYGEDFHQTSNQLGAARTIANFIEKYPDMPEKVIEAARKIEKNIISIIRMRETIQYIPQQMEFQQFNIYDLLNRALAENRKSSHIIVDWNRKLNYQEASVRGLERQLQQVFRLIIYNAIAAMSGEGLLTFSVEKDATPDDDRIALLGNVAVTKVPEFVLVHISDTGSGITADALPYIFEINVPRKYRSTKGASFGLAWARLFMRWFGGDITCETSRSGTTMTIVIPKIFFIPDYR